MRQATGIDLTPAMLEEARKAAAHRRLRNVALDRGDVYALLYDDGSFSIVIERYAFHHLLEPFAFNGAIDRGRPNGDVNPGRRFRRVMHQG